MEKGDVVRTAALPLPPSLLPLADSCRKGTPFSYAATGSSYSKADNSFLLFNYNRLRVVAERACCVLGLL